MSGVYHTSSCVCVDYNMRITQLTFKEKSGVTHTRIVCVVIVICEQVWSEWGQEVWKHQIAADSWKGELLLIGETEGQNAGWCWLLVPTLLKGDKIVEKMMIMQKESHFSAASQPPFSSVIRFLQLIQFFAICAWALRKHQKWWLQKHQYPFPLTADTIAIRGAHRPTAGWHLLSGKRIKR